MIYRTYVELAPLCLCSLSLVWFSCWVQWCSIIACDAVIISCWICSAWIAMAEEVAWGMGVLVFFLLAAEEGQGKSADSHSQSKPAVKDREIGALMLTAGWLASCFLQQGNIYRGTEQIHYNGAMPLESAVYLPHTHTIHYLTKTFQCNSVMSFLIKFHCLSLLSNSVSHIYCTHPLIEILRNIEQLY